MKTDDPSILNRQHTGFALGWPLPMLFALIGVLLLAWSHLSLEHVVLVVACCGAIVGAVRYWFRRGDAFPTELRTAAAALSSEEKPDSERAQFLYGNLRNLETPPAKPNVANIKEAQVLYRSMELNVRLLVKLQEVAPELPRVAIKESWLLLEKSVLEHAKFDGFQKIDNEGSELSQAIRYLTFDVLESTDVMIAVYSLFDLIRKLEKDPNMDIGAEAAQQFLRYCIEIIGNLGYELSKRLRNSLSVFSR